MRLTMLIGMAKQIPWAEWMMAVFMPITRPLAVQQRAAAIAGVERGIGLDHVVDQMAGDAAQGAAQAH